jgi:phosphate transport system substrate-binding protein
MTRSMLLGAVSAAALIVSSGAFAQSTAITGGGSTLAEFDYFVEFADFNNLEASGKPTFNNANPSPFAPATTDEGLYWASGSGTGQNSLLYNNLTCDANKTLKNNTVSPYCTAPANVGNGVNLETIYGASDATLTASQYAGWTSGTSYTDYASVEVTVPSQQAVAGNLIELPAMGVGVSFPVVNSGVTSNAQVELQDSDICGIFSGKITNWSTIAADSYNKNKGITAGTIQVVYRSDSSGTSFILTEHLAKACPTVSGAPPSFLGFTPTLTFASLFSGSTPPANFVGVSGSQGIASYISGQTVTTIPANTAFADSDFTYLTPDLTTIDPNSNAFLNNGNKSTLVVAAVYTPNSKKYFTPTYTNIATGLTHVLTYDTTNGSSGVPASVAEAEANNAFVQVPTSIGSGYEYSGYTTFDFAQCYANAAIGTAITAFLNYHYTNTTFTAVQENNGFVPLSSTGATKYLAAIDKYVVDDTGTKGKYPDQGTQIGSAKGCAGLTGR